MQLKTSFLALIFTFLYFICEGQISFSNSNYLIPNHNFNSGVGLGISDMNNDGLSDIIHLDLGRNLLISYQMPGEAFNTIEYQSMANSSQWALCAADIDNNGFTDIFCGGNYDGLKVAVADNQGTSFELSVLPGDNIFTQASNFADINNDGFVDIFACHDDGKSKIYLNDGNGSFIESNMIDFTTTPASDNSGNYGAVWSDIDNDGDIDLYIAKCRQGVSDASDPRRINALYINDGQNNYTEMAEEYGLKIGAQSWTADFGDMDNDGDMDCFITNHDVDSQILENDGTGHFTDITASTNLDIPGLPIQGIWEDFDNDGYLDILVAGSKHSIWKNNGDKTFTFIEAFGDNDMESFATGDLNSDGFIDVMGGYANIYTSPSDIDDVIWINSGNSNNYIGVNLTGIISNRAAIGSRIEIFGDWGTQIREVRAGESYGIMNDMQQIFGLGEANIIDSMVVKWPSGLVTSLTDLEVNQIYNILEQDCETMTIDVTADSDNFTLCEGDIITLSGPDGYDNYLWSNDVVTQNLNVSSPGMYFLQVEDDQGCIGLSSSIIIQGPEILNPVISTLDELTPCKGDEITIDLEGVDSNFSWSNGAEDLSLSVSESGTYFVEAINNCNQSYLSNELTVEYIEVGVPSIEPDTIIEAGSYTFTSNNALTNWYENNPPVGEPIATGSLFETGILSENITIYAQAFNNNDQEFFSGETEQIGSNVFSGGQYNGAIQFDCFKTFIIQSVDVYAEILGDRIIQVLNNDGEVIHSKTVTIELEGWSTLELDFEIQPGENYSMTTDSDFNNEVYGENSPFFARNNQDVSYPYILGDVGELTSSNFGSPYYYYFYNWLIKVEKEPCYSELIEVQGVYNPDTNTEDLYTSYDLTVYPNPSNNTISIKDVLLQEMDQIQVFDVYGKLHNVSINQEAIEINHLASGLYLLEMRKGNQLLKASFIKK
jgi:hypothetical protein